MRRFRRLRANSAVRELVCERRLSTEQLIYPLFVIDSPSARRDIASMPGVAQLGFAELLAECERALALGVRKILLFGVLDAAAKDERGSDACSDSGLIARAARAIKERFGEQIYLIADLCFCEYTSHGHCGILRANGCVDNDATLEISAQQALVMARAGVDMIAPSGMMDGIVATLRAALDAAGFTQLPIMAYSSKFASAFYGPFRDVAQSAPSHGDRAGYQMQPSNGREAVAESLEDERQGADVLMIKPAMAYLDIVRAVREATSAPLCVYNVSGEYAMLKHAAAAGLIEYERTVRELMVGFLRAGADMIITYHALELAEWLRR